MITPDEVLDSPDKKNRKEKWVGIVIHHTSVGNRFERDIDESLWRRLQRNIAQWLATKDDVYVSAHYQIGRYGELTQIVDPKFVAYHAGLSSYWNPIDRKWRQGCNEFMIGIELLGDGNRIIYSVEQYDKCAELCANLMMEFDTINPNLIVGHDMVAPGRKDDPGKFFDWRKFFDLLYEHRERLKNEHFGN